MEKMVILEWKETREIQEWMLVDLEMIYSAFPSFFACLSFRVKEAQKDLGELLVHREEKDHLVYQEWRSGDVIEI